VRKVTEKAPNKEKVAETEEEFEDFEDLEDVDFLLEDIEDKVAPLA
jgi:hypothetical protein